LVWKILLFFFIFTFTSFSSVSGEEGTSQTLAYKNFIVQYPLSNEKLALKVSFLLKQHVNYFENFYQHEIKKPAFILIAESPEKFFAYSNERLPEWAGAAYLSSRNAILLKKISWTGSEMTFEGDFLHELSHLYFDRKFGNVSIPLWYNEGLAEYLSKKDIDFQSSIRISSAILANTIIPFNKIDSLLFFSRNKAELAYIQSLSAVLFLRREFSNQADWDAFHNSILKSGWKDALNKQTGLDDVDFEIAWFRNTEKKYKWLFLLNAENLVWVIMIVVLIMSMYWMRYRNKKIMDRWGEEELFEGYENYYFQSDDSDTTS
jgi:hypothetical protein